MAPLRRRELQFATVFEATIAGYGVRGEPSEASTRTRSIRWTMPTECTEKVGEIMDVTDVSLNQFRAHGGKIILTHGTIDDFITPHNTELYYQRQVKQFGQAGVDSFIRFYMIPGFGHGFGPFNAKIDSLTALQDVGRAGAGAGRASPRSTGTPTRIARVRCASGRSGRSSPGTPGSEGNAASFACVAP